MELHSVTVAGGAGQRGVVVGNKLIELDDLSWPRFVPAGLGDRRASELLGESKRSTYAGSRSVAALTEQTRKLVAGLRSRIAAERHERAATAVSCAMLLLLGAVLSVRFRGQSPLVVYFWSFLLAIVTLIIISSGVNVGRGTSASEGLAMAVVWSGNLLLLAVVLGNYRKLARN